MIQRKSLLVFAGITLLSAVAPVAVLRAQVAAPVAIIAPTTFDFDLGSRTMDGATYSVKATQPADSKLKSQRVRFTAVVGTAAGTSTRYFTINTGKYKTVAQLNAYLRDVFARFLSGAPVDSEVGKVGDIKYGGEIRFVVQSPGTLRANTMTPGEPNDSMTLPAAEVKAYASILAGR